MVGTLDVTVIFDGQVIDSTQLLGATTVTVKLQLVLPLVSLAVLITVVVPTWNELPDAGVEFTVGVPPHESLAVTVKNTLAGPLFVTVMFDGQAIDTTHLPVAANAAGAASAIIIMKNRSKVFIVILFKMGHGAGKTPGPPRVSHR